MSDLKIKPDRHKWRTHKTLDEMHEEKMKSFESKKTELPNMKKTLKQYELEYNELLEKKMLSDNQQENFNIIKKKLELKNKISDLKKEITIIENNTEQYEYLNKTCDILCEYYNVTNGKLYGKEFEDCIQNETSINDVKTSKIEISEELQKIINQNSDKKIKKPVKKRRRKIEEHVEYYNILDDLGLTQTNKDTENSANIKAMLQDNYLSLMDKEYLCSKKTKINIKCEKCNVDKIIVYAESIMSCPNCGDTNEIFIDAEIPSQRDSYTEKPKYPYKKIDHCKEKLDQFLCNSTTNIPSSIFSMFDKEIKKNNLTSKQVTLKFVENTLKKCKKSEYYEYSMYIYCKITKNKPPYVSKDEYDTVLKMFEIAEEIYEKKYKKPDRDNFLKYTFVIHKIFLTLNRPDVAQYFNVLKSAGKLKYQEQIWKNICIDAGWQYL